MHYTYNNVNERIKFLIIIYINAYYYNYDDAMSLYF